MWVEECWEDGGVRNVLKVGELNKSVKEADIPEKLAWKT